MLYVTNEKRFFSQSNSVVLKKCLFVYKLLKRLLKSLLMLEACQRKRKAFIIHKSKLYT